MKSYCIVLLISIASMDLFSQVHWIKHPDNPVMIPGSPGEWDEVIIAPGSVLYQGEKYHMWYWGGDFETVNQRIGYATSPDGITWEKSANNPVLEPGIDGAWDGVAVGDPTVIFVDSIFHMWYEGIPKFSLSDSMQIGHATSPDGINWTKDSNNPVLRLGPAGDWDDKWVSQPEVIFNDNEYHMWYGAYDGIAEQNRIGHATSPDGDVWTKDPANPILSYESGKWDYPRVDFPKVIFSDNFYQMWYSGGQFAAWKIGYAISEDGSVWTKFSKNPVLKGKDGTWDERFAAFSPVIDSAGIKYKMWYMGGVDVYSSGIGYAESPIPPWKLMEPVDIRIGTHPSAVIDSTIYVFGGTDAAAHSINSAFAYNTTTNQWSELANMPEDESMCSAETVNGKIYVIGGWRHVNGNWITSNTTMEYDPEGDSWQKKKDCPYSTGANSSCVLNDSIYILGGARDWPNRDTSGQRQALVYDPATDTWDSIPEMLYERSDACACVLDGQIYVFGGMLSTPTSFYIIGKTENYDPAEKVWTELADMPVPVVNHISMVHDNKILVFGGDTGTFTLNKSYGTNIIQEYDPSTDSWKLLQNMPVRRTGMAGEKVYDFVYLIGGYLYSRDLHGPLSEVWRFDLESPNPLISVTGISLDQHSLELIRTETATLFATVTPEFATNPSVSWRSAGLGIATVSEEGKVTGVGVGQTYIYVTTSDGNFKDSCYVSITHGVGIKNSLADRLSIFPNPTYDQLTIQTEQHGQKTIEITSLNGQLIYSIEMEGTTHQIDLSSFQKGVYLITIRSKDNVTTRKIIKL